MLNVMKLGRIATDAMPDVNRMMPASIPNLRPRWSATEPKTGANIPTNERAVMTKDRVVISTPSPRAKTAKNGYTILCIVFRTVRTNMKMTS